MIAQLVTRKDKKQNEAKSKRQSFYQNFEEMGSEWKDRDQPFFFFKGCEDETVRCDLVSNYKKKIDLFLI